MSDILNEKLSAVSSAPGVYLMKDAGGKVIYVGKARNLKKRIASYFRPPEQLDIKTGVLVKKIADFDTIITRTENDALLLESNLIKQHRPRYNVILKDDKRYPSLRLDLAHPYPNLTMVRKTAHDGALYFGPFSSPPAVHQTLKFINKTFKLRKCGAKIFRNRSRPCLNYQMGICLGPCCLEVEQSAYEEIVKEVILFLRGRTPDLIRKIKADMAAAAAAQDYESAAVLRDKMFALEKILEKQISVTSDFMDRDVLAIARSPERSVITMLFVRGGYLLGTRHFEFAETLSTEAEIIEGFIRQYYSVGCGMWDVGCGMWDVGCGMWDVGCGLSGVGCGGLSVAGSDSQLASGNQQPATNNQQLAASNQHPATSIPPHPPTSHIPKEILVPIFPEDKTLTEDWLKNLKGQKIRILNPQRGEKAQLLQMARQNAENELKNRTASAAEDRERLDRLQKRLKINNFPERIECFDNSNISGTNPVAGMVAFVNGKPDPSSYRKYRIKTVPEQDDYAYMAEALERRYGKGKDSEPYPDLLMVDGGKGQLNIAVSVISQLGLGGKFDMIGIAKKDEKNGETEDKIFKPGRANPLNFGREKDLLFFLQRIRDEAHRYAITFHRKRRKESSLSSVLDTIPGIGKKRKQTLLRHFGSIRHIREASVEEIAALPGMNRPLAETVKEKLIIEN